MIDYNRVTSLPRDDFEALSPNLSDVRDASKYTQSDGEDIARMERLLDLKEGMLAGDEYYLERAVCDCGRLLTMYDFVFTGLVDAEHSKSLIVHTFLGNKFVLNQARRIRCSACGRLSGFHSYRMSNYSCSVGLADV